MKKLAVAIMLGIGVMVSGCDNQQSVQNTTTQSQQTQTQIIHEKFVNIPMRATYDQVKATFGVDGKPVASNQISNVTTESYKFIVNGERFYMTFQNGELSTKQCFKVGCCVNKITLEQFNKIQMGMTYEQVAQIFGDAGDLESQTQYTHGYKSSIMTWMNKDGSNARITFDKSGTVKVKVQVRLQ